jgi:adenylosuccinate lyase
VLRNQGVAIAHSVLVVRNANQALNRVSPDKAHMAAELEEHWEVLAEPIQTVMRRLGKDAPYEKLKTLTRGHHLTKEALHEFINGLDIPKKDKQHLLSLTPANYIGLSVKVAEL